MAGADRFSNSRVSDLHNMAGARRAGTNDHETPGFKAFQRCDDVRAIYGAKDIQG